jgi:hypothetical protein
VLWQQRNHGSSGSNAIAFGTFGRKFFFFFQSDGSLFYCPSFHMLDNFHPANGTTVFVPRLKFGISPSLLIHSLFILILNSPT